MNWLNLSALIVNWFTIGLLLGMNRSLRKRNDRLQADLFKDPAPKYDKNCRGCGRPITQAMGTWRDHAGRFECDGRVTQLERHEP